jgi:hypothetical protein
VCLGGPYTHTTLTTDDVQEFEAERGAARPRRGRAEPERKVSASGAMAAVLDFLDDD